MDFATTLPSRCCSEKNCLDSNSTFINFNYTNTLQRLYNIPAQNILFIHNQAINSDSTLILGHSRNPKLNESLEKVYNDNMDPRIAEGNRILDQYFAETYKSTEKIIQDNSGFFDKLSTI